MRAAATADAWPRVVVRRRCAVETDAATGRGGVQYVETNGAMLKSWSDDDDDDDDDER